MKSVVILPVLDFYLVDNNLLINENIELIKYNKNLNINDIKKSKNIFVYEKNPYISNYIIIKNFFKKIKQEKKISFKKLYNALKDNINYYNEIPNLLENLKDVSENIYIIENTNDIIVNN